jgi:hypothetical protein
MLTQKLPMVIASQIYAKGPNRQEKLALERLEQGIWQSVRAHENASVHNLAYQTPDWLYDWSRVDQFYSGLNSSMMSSTNHLKNLMTLSRFHAKSLLNRKLHHYHWNPEMVLDFSRYVFITSQKVFFFFYRNPFF